MNVIAILNIVLSLFVCVCVCVLNMTFKESGLFPASDVRKRVFFSFLARVTVTYLRNKHLGLS